MIKIRTIGMFFTDKNNPEIRLDYDVPNYSFQSIFGDMYLVSNVDNGKKGSDYDVVIPAGEPLNCFLLRAWDGQSVIVDNKHISEDISLLKVDDVLVVGTDGKLQGGDVSDVCFVVSDPKVFLTEDAVEFRIVDTSSGSGGIAPVPSGSTITSPITATKTVGGVTAGDPIPAGTTFEELFRLILSPALTPSLVGPSATLTTNTARRIYGFDEDIGNVQFEIYFYRGSISPAYGTSGYRAGEATAYTIDGKSGQRVTVNMDEKLQGVGKTAISGTVAYSAGEQPKDSKGDNYDRSLSAGNVNSNAISFEKKPYIYTTKSGTLDRMPIEQYNSSPIDFEQKHGDGVTWPKSTIALPAKATGIFVWNDVSKDWQENSREFTEEVVTIDNMTYYKYVDSRPYTAGDRRLKFTY